MKRLLILSFFPFLFAGTTPKWCDRPLYHGQLLRDVHGAYYVLDGQRLRQFSDSALIRHYHVDRRNQCYLTRRYFQTYQHGTVIYFPPYQDLHQASFLKVAGKSSLYLWYRGRIHLVRHVKPAQFYGFDQQVYSFSLLALQSFSQGNLLSSKTLLSGVIRRFRNLCSLRLQDSWCRISCQRLSQLARPPYVLYQRFSPALSSCALRTQFVDGTLVAMHSSPVYVIRSGKRYFLWNQQQQLRSRYGKKRIIRLTRDELYSIPYGGNVY